MFGTDEKYVLYRFRRENEVYLMPYHELLSDYTQIMKANIANKLNIEPSRISIKCGTNEKLGYVGKMKGIECFSTVLLMEEKDKHE